ncbi:ABC transporter ATP-binding protein [Planotetraspora thailandica]|uniref:ABC transporter ATP-binding protein n=1 Tax=Planotetraspora thailandica TaxID=487172 RepID=A0A8J3UUQ8_9ACTN|nr:ABC transporter ATP-binding protein [Planotetraspora thailandica]GII51722.1 ABC transporter ATP-binding protein [Planotetraspora thailandica]
MSTADALIARAARHSGRWLVLLAFTALAGAAAELLLPMALGRALDALTGTPVSGAAPNASVPAAVVFVAWLVALVVACDVLGVLASGVSGAEAAQWLRRRVTARVLAAGTTTTRRFTTGDLVTRAGVNVEEAARGPEAVVTAASLVIPSAGSVVALVLIDPLLGATLTAGLLVVLGVVRAFMHKTTVAASGYQEAQAEIAARLVGALAGARTIIAAGTQDQEVHRVLAPLPRLREHGLSLWRLHARAGVQAAVVIPLLETAVLAVGGLRLAGGHLSMGELLASARYAVLGAGLGSAVGYAGRLARARSAARRIDRLLAEPALPYGSRRPAEGRGRLELRRVSVRVNGSPLLSDVDLVVPGGCCVAVVGRSGSGKSSLAAVAGRLLDPDVGSVLLDGVPLPQIGREHLRRAIGYAFERPVLLGATLGDAIGFGLPPERRDGTSPGNGLPSSGGIGPGWRSAAGRVRAASQAACADAFIRLMPGGYGTPLSGAPMSGGQVQRVGLARAFAQAERVLILDDAMSSLDTVTERQVSRALTGSLAGRTRLIVTHRVATAARADQVVWLDGGRVRAHGTHESLWNDPDYRAVFQGAS